MDLWGSWTADMRPDPQISDQASREKCNAFWTAMNGGVCSDSMGRYVRKDGTSVTFEEQIATGKASSGATSQFIVVGSLVLFAVLLIKTIKN